MSMIDTLKLYFHYIGISIRAQMQYKASFVMSSVGQLAVTFIEFLCIWALFDRFGSLRGWSLPEVALLYGIVNTALALSESIVRGFDTFPSMVKSGDFDRILLRPRSTTLQIAAQELQLMRIGRFLQGLAILIWSGFSLNIDWTPAQLLLLIVSIIGGACIFSGFFILQATTCFWTIDTIEMGNVITYGGTETAQYPLDIYRSWFRKFFTFVFPLACVNYFPALAILGRAGSHGIPAIAGWVSPLLGVLFLMITMKIWDFGVRRYTSTGS